MNMAHSGLREQTSGFRRGTRVQALGCWAGLLRGSGANRGPS